MPSFLLLPDDEIDALVEYVKYLSLRGQTETLLLIKVLDEGDPIDLKTVKLSDLASEYVTPVAESWAQAESSIIVPPDGPPTDTPEALAASIAKGAELFRGAKAQCAKCHGPTAMGDGSEELLFDDWNKVKQFADLAKKIADAEQIADRKERSEALGELQTKLISENDKWLLPQQQVQPRNLRMGIYRFGRRPVDMYRRIFRRHQWHAHAARWRRCQQSQWYDARRNLAHRQLRPHAPVREAQRSVRGQGAVGGSRYVA